jgi:hypothetical protein
MTSVEKREKKVENKLSAPFIDAARWKVGSSRSRGYGIDISSSTGRNLAHGICGHVEGKIWKHFPGGEPL